MDLNEPKWDQKNLYKMILYELKMGLNELKWISLNKLKIAQMSWNKP